VAASKLEGRTTTLERRPEVRRGAVIPSGAGMSVGQLADGDEGDREQSVGESAGEGVG
jgi:hypothetical protein